MIRIYQFIGTFLLFLVLANAPTAFAAAQKTTEQFSLQQFGMTVAQIKKAASEGDADAQYALGYMYYYGKDLAKDQQAASFWIGKAAAQGQPQAVKAQQLLNLSSSTPNTSQAAEASANPNLNSNQNPNQAAANNPDNNNVVNNAAPQANVEANSPAQQANANNNNAPQDNAAQQSPDQAPNPANQQSVQNDQNPAASTSADNAAAQSADNNAPNNQLTGIPATTPQAEKRPAVHSKQVHNAHHAKSHALAANSTTSAKKLLAAPAHSFTLQLLGAYRNSDAQAFINKHHLQGKAMVYKTTFNNKPWYVVVYGIYHDAAAAKAGVQTLPEPVQHLNPWVKPISSVKVALENN